MSDESPAAFGVAAEGDAAAAGRESVRGTWRTRWAGCVAVSELSRRAERRRLLGDSGDTSSPPRASLTGTGVAAIVAIPSSFL